MLGRPLIRFDSVPSTMTVLADLASAGAPEGTTVVTGFQSSGRGRTGRAWVTPPHTSLLCSVLLRPHLALQRLTPLSILVADAITSVTRDRYGLDARIKWPNDVLVGGKKLSGVLIQTQASGPFPNVNIGIGVNANILPHDLPETATSLFAECGSLLDIDHLLRQVLDAVGARYLALLDDSLEPIWAGIQDRLAMRNDFVTVQEGAASVTGHLLRIDPDGSLVLIEGGTLRRVVVGDLVRGPRLPTNIREEARISGRNTRI